MSLFGAAIMVGPVLGPSLGGFLVDDFGWRAVFFVNLPIGLLAFAGTAIGLAGLPPSRTMRIDFAGFSIFGCGIVALQLLLDRGPRAGWFGSREIRVDTALALTGLAVAVLRAVHRDEAFPALAPFRDRNFAVTTTCSFLAGFVVIGSIVLVPSLLQNVLGHDATSAGLAMAPRGVGTMVMMLAMSRTIGTIDHRVLLLSGVLLIALALFGLSMVTADWSVLAIGALSLLQGVGVGLIFTPLSTAAFSFLAPELRADATGVYSLLRNIGGSTGVAVLSALALPQGFALAQRLASYRLDFLILLGVVCVMGAASLLIRTDLDAAAAAARSGGEGE
jgi:DHA2 family multidrug resistance protein